ncbi:MAG: tripartite tricarboxylate transporter TctB family protein [Pseudomonadota bacterium]
MAAPSRAADRASGLALVALSVLLLAVVFPAGIETVERGWVRPITLPRAMAVLIGICGALIAWRARPHAAPDVAQSLHALAVWGGLALGVAAVAAVGFLLAGPVLALALMLGTGERRPLWLLTGTVLVPAAIWALVVMGLDRPLP